MHVDMEDHLAAMPITIHYQAVTILSDTLLISNLLRGQNHFTNQFSMRWLNIIKRGNFYLRYD
jgi:hypothetical protein